MARAIKELIWESRLTRHWTAQRVIWDIHWLHSAWISSSLGVGIRVVISDDHPDPQARSVSWLAERTLASWSSLSHETF